ncbi:uncharacterized protein TNCV_2414181 [Trichonephila clavipes]|nr:uncharacterized protein TNCV_2414181 [Trichonephila clavipes]
MNTIVFTAETESGFASLKTNETPLHFSFLVRGTTPNGDINEWASRVAHVMGSAIANVFQLGVFVWFEKTQGPLLKVPPVPGWRPMKQLAVRVHFLDGAVFLTAGLSRAS